MSTPRDGYGATATIGGVTFALDGPWFVTPAALERVREMAALPPIEPHNCRCVFATDALTVVAAQALRDWTAEGGNPGPVAGSIEAEAERAARIEAAIERHFLADEDEDTVIVDGPAEPELPEPIIARAT